MKPLAHSVAALLLASVLGPALAQAPASTNDHDSHHPVTTPAAQDNSGRSSADQDDLSDGEITRWDPRTGKVTLRHGEIKNLGMPPMTMVFTVQGAAPASEFKRGDKVRFRAEQVNGVFVVTHLEAVN